MAEAADPASEAEIDNEEFILRKRLPRKLPLRKNDVYITNKSNFMYQLKRCRRLLEQGFTEVYVHGLGAAVPRALNVALRLQADSAHMLETAVHTSTVQLVDDFEPQGDSSAGPRQTRLNSAIHVKVFHKQSAMEKRAISKSDMLPQGPEYKTLDPSLDIEMNN